MKPSSKRGCARVETTSTHEFEREIDATANTKRWVFLDVEALEELSTSGWSAAGDEGARWLRQAIDRDDVEIARRLIALGADLNGPPEYRSAQYRLPPLMAARSRAMVDLLVEADADPNQRAIGAVAAQTPLMTTAYKDADVAEALLKAGAHVEDLDDGRSALWYAACRGNWRVVTVLLRAGAKAWGGTDMSALECTRQARQGRASRPRTVLDRGGPTIEDFDRVIALLESATRKSPSTFRTIWQRPARLFPWSTPAHVAQQWPKPLLPVFGRRLPEVARNAKVRARGIHQVPGAPCSRACLSANRQKIGHQRTSLNTQIQPKLQGSAPVDAL